MKILKKFSIQQNNPILFFWRPAVALGICIVAGLGSWGSIAEASTRNEQVIDLNVHFVASEGETRTVDLPRRYYVRKLYIQAEGVGRDAYAQVSSRGDVKGTIYAPGRDPHYIVTVAEETSSIQVSVISGQLRILNIKAVVNDYLNPGYPGELPKSLIDLTTRTIELARFLNDSLEGGVHVDAFRPVILAASRARAILVARGQLSETARAELRRLLEKMVDVNDNDPLVDHLLYNWQTQAAMVDFLSIDQRIRYILD